jgi:hypothetical protein
MIAIDNDAIEAAKKRFHNATKQMFFTHDYFIKNLRSANEPDSFNPVFYLDNAKDHEYNLYTIFLPAFFKAKKEYTNLVAPLIGIHDFECMEIVNSWHFFMMEAANLIRHSACDANIFSDICTNDVYECE